MVWHQSPCETGCTGLGEDFSESANKGIRVSVIPEDLPLLNSADHNVVESARCIDASSSRHGRIVVIPVKSCQSIPSPSSTGLRENCRERHIATQSWNLGGAGYGFRTQALPIRF